MSDYPSDLAMFAPLTPEENRILSMHLNSGWYKQAAVYPGVSGPWLETEALLEDLSEAHGAAMQARPPARSQLQVCIAEPERREPEAGQ
jgi:hypothetical protein